jgi:DNA-directed RNA polymerase subunit RPC12/RpoP
MSDTLQFTCPECGKQMKLPAATAGRQGSCPACKKRVTIKPDPPAAAAPAPAIPLAEVAEPVGDVLAALVVEPQFVQPELVQPEMVQPEMVQPELVQPEMVQPGIVQPEMVQPELVQPEMVQPGIVQPAGIQPVGMAPPMAQPQQSADSKKKIIIFVAAGGGGMLLLLLLLLLFMGGGDQSSPEALGRAVFNAVKSNDKDLLYSLGPSVGAIRSLQAQLLAEVEDEDERKEIDVELTDEELVEGMIKGWRDGIGDDFDDVVDALNWRDASVVTIVSEHDPDNPTKGPRGLEFLTVCDFIFVVCDVKDDLYVLIIDGCWLIKGSWYISDDDMRVQRVSKAGRLRTLLERTKDPNRARILRELPKEDDELF